MKNTVKDIAKFTAGLKLSNDILVLSGKGAAEGTLTGLHITNETIELKIDVPMPKPRKGNHGKRPRT